MAEETRVLQRRISALERRVWLLGVCCAVMAAYIVASPGDRVKAATQADSITVKRLAVVDDRGTERVVIAAPLPDPIVQGKRVKRDAPVSGILIYDPKGNERGGYVTSDTGSLGAFITLDTETDQVFTAYANQDSGATVWAANEKHDSVAFTTYQQPRLEVIRNKKVIFKQPPDAPDLH